MTLRIVTGGRPPATVTVGKVAAVVLGAERAVHVVATRARHAARTGARPAAGFGTYMDGIIIQPWAVQGMSSKNRTCQPGYPRHRRY